MNGFVRGVSLFIICSWFYFEQIMINRDPPRTNHDLYIEKNDLLQYLKHYCNLK